MKEYPTYLTAVAAADLARRGHHPGKPSYLLQEQWDRLCERSLTCVYVHAVFGMAGRDHERIADALVEVLLSLSAHNEDLGKRMVEMLERHPTPIVIARKEF